MQNPIEKKVNPFALDSNTNVAYEAKRWQERGQPAGGDPKALEWKARKTAGGEWTADLAPKASLERVKEDDPLIKDEYAEEKADS